MEEIQKAINRTYVAVKGITRENIIYIEDNILKFAQEKLKEDGFSFPHRMDFWDSHCYLFGDGFIVSKTNLYVDLYSKTEKGLGKMAEQLGLPLK